MPLIFLHCQQLDPNAEQAYFRVDGDLAWKTYDPLIIVASTPSGQIIDTLYRGKVDSLNELWALAAPHYDGGAVMIAIYGYRNGALAFSQGRDYDGLTQKVLAIRDTIPVLQGNTIATNPTAPTTPTTAIKKDSTPSGTTTQAPPGSTGVENAPPKIFLAFAETTVSIRDVVPMSARVESGLKKITFVGWDYEGDGKIDDSLKTLSGTLFSAKPRFSDVGLYACRFVVRTANGQAEATIQIHVILDPPTADAGEDTTVAPGTPILLHAIGHDGFGPIVKREWQFDEGTFKSVTQQETKFTAPMDIGDYDFVLRITDSDGLTALDTLTVTVDDALDLSEE